MMLSFICQPSRLIRYKNMSRCVALIHEPDCMIRAMYTPPLSIRMLAIVTLVWLYIDCN